ncbi:TylF/MycF family methyltransferase [Bacillus wiedmannii]|uniref:TylF/MycF family methyltransferase n=1 Tax=Bacillus wiedmannii TaxID=1890302 RepID=UPI000BEB57BC|nr:TylF/MycF family methyltransferase [Bacillus wiedmannii]PEF43390.1 macrocin O-methyltransferase [Bacillus wiedmannii]
MNSIQYGDLYLELLKKTILFEIWYEYESYFPFPTVEENSADVQYVKQIQAVTTDVNRRKYGLDWPILAHSMIGRTRLNQLHQAMQTVLDEKIEGDFIETGVWRGGACIFMRGFLKNYNILDRKVWVADSFEGLPMPSAEKYPVDENDILYKFNYLSVSLEDVKRNFEKFDLLDEHVMFLKGWFKDTLPVAPINKVAIARLDGDMYESTMDSLTNLYDKVSPGGFIIIDDYSLYTCKTAVTDFRRDRNINDPLQNIDQCSVFWRKSK